jgi:glucose/arabinose dehydrogenase
MLKPRGRRISLIVGAVGALLSLGLWTASIADAGVKPTFSGPFFSQQTTFGFAQPIGMAIAPGGRIFVTDNAGILWTTMGGGAKAKPLFDLSEHVNETQDRGLVSVAVDKDYSLNRKIYLAYTFEDRTKAELEANSSLAELPKTERLVWVKVPTELELEALTEPIKLKPEDEHVVIGSYSSDPKRPGVPFSTTHACPQPSDLVNGNWSTENETDCIPDDSVEHTIDSVRVDPNDGMLWVSIGDGAGGDAALDPDSWRSQREESYSGKLLHIGTNGEGLAGHPFCPSDEKLTDVCTKIYAKGFRNPFRFFFRPAPDGRPTVADAGWSTREELDLAEKGKNFGWPCHEGKVSTPTWSERSECVELSSKETFVEPVYDYPNITGGAILGGITYTGSGGPSDYPAEYKGAIFISDFVTNEVKYLRLNEAGTAVEPGYPKVFADNLMAVDWATAANGDLMYVDIGFGPSELAQVRQISFDSENAPPEAVATADKTHGPLPLKVEFDASKSSDPNGDPLTYEWDLDGDGETDSTSQKPKETYEKAENVEVTLRVKDGHGHEGIATMKLYPGDEAPSPKFDSGPNTYTDGEPIEFKGSATDPENGALSTSALSWNVKLNHGGTHIHPITSKSGVGSIGFTTVTDHDAPSTYIVELTATDSRGLTTTIERVLQPLTKLVRIDSSPEGAPITYGALGQTAPYEKQSTIGLDLTLSAASTFTQGGSIYEFEGWSDGGERIHDLVIPGKDVSLTANYNLAPTKLFKLIVSKSGTGTGEVTSTPAGVDCGATCSAEFEEGKVVELKQEASPGSEFKEWSGACSGTGSCKVTMSEARSVGAKFEKLGGDTGGGGSKEGPVGDTSAATLAFDPTHGLANKPKAVLRGTAGDASGLRTVQVALRQARKNKGRCRWWSQGKGGFPKGTASCAHPTYMKAKLKGAGEQVSWALPLDGHLPAGRYLLFFRTEDGAGNVGGGSNGSKPVTLRVK